MFKNARSRSQRSRLGALWIASTLLATTLGATPPASKEAGKKPGTLWAAGRCGLRVAEQGGKHYLQIQGFMAVRQVAVGPDDSDEKNTANAELLKRADEIKAFNDLHGSWIYEVSDTVAEKVRMRRAELLGG